MEIRGDDVKKIAAGGDKCGKGMGGCVRDE
jgi:hypothetical protein